jgi:PEP-CTERM motif-containing protein
MRLSRRSEIVSTVVSGRAMRASLALAVVAVAAGRASATNYFTAGDLVVDTYAYGMTSLADGAPTPITLEEFSTSGGAPILTDTLPTTDGVGGSYNLGIVGEYGSSSEGNIQLSGNDQYLTINGYGATAAAAGIDQSTINANPGTPQSDLGMPFSKSTVALAQATDTDLPRIPTLIDANNNVNSSTVLNDVYNTNNPRALYSATGSSFYVSGQGDGNTPDQGIFQGTVGMNTVNNPSDAPTPIYNAHDTRFVTQYGGNTYYSIDTSSGKFTGVQELPGSPSTLQSSPIAITTGNNGGSGKNEVFYSPEGFYFANSTTLYVADTGVPKAISVSKGDTLADGGIQKWTFNGSSWVLQYTMIPTGGDWLTGATSATATSGETGFEAITGEVVGNSVKLFAVSYTAGDDNPDGLYAITDSLPATNDAGETFTELESAAGNGGPTFKGVSFAPVPEPTTLSLMAGGSALGLLRRRRKVQI